MDDTGTAQLDFNTVIPQPEELSDIQIGGGDKRWRVVDGENIDLTETELQHLQDQYGSIDWYDWSVKNWGTKWNAIDTDIQENILFFSTAWSPPLPFVQAASKMFPRLTFELEYKEEGDGFFGVSAFQAGEQTH